MYEQQSASRAYLSALEARLAADQCRTWWEDWAGAPVLIGRRADFKWRWAGTKLHLFTVAAAVPEITIPTIETFTEQVLAYAKKTKGGLPLGLQTGIGAFPLLVSDRVDPAAVRWAEAQQRNKWACMARPVVVDSAHQYVGSYRGTPAIGMAYSSYFEQKAMRYFYG
ncbi:Levansucrase [Streptomyces graminofaciens]|uniref:Levansucrase n=1 Tax=Streptomyces graminofaciens TaxID=68212 RepID=A0ABM9SBX4_9ACTN|nr:levansucrase [Streptomyces graminofaciens]BBC33518.1 Levansucrase [Streptomyces graminofaciens]